MNPKKAAKTQSVASRAVARRGIVISSAYANRSSSGGMMPERERLAVRDTLRAKREHLKNAG